MTKQTLIPALHANIFWNDDEKDGTTGGAEIVVTDTRERHEQSDLRGKDHYCNSTGANTAGWMTEVHPQARPEGVFAASWLDRPASREAIKAALREFGKIEECEWARQMHKTLDEIDQRNLVATS